MALGPEGLLTESAQGSEMRCIKMSPTDVCSRLSLEDNRRAATLFVNLGQCLLNVPGPSREATIAALEAVEVSSSLFGCHYLSPDKRTMLKFIPILVMFALPKPEKTDAAAQRIPCT